MSTAFNSGFAVAGRTIADVVAADGTAATHQAKVLRAGGAQTRDLSDAVHMLCALHGATPSIVDLAIAARGGEAVQLWMRGAAATFDEERRLLAALTAAIGPQPSTPGQAEAEAAIGGQQRALATLARSDRSGCALGAAFAFLLDWHAIRAVLSAAADRVGSPLPESQLPSVHDISVIAAGPAEQPAVARAMMFGAQQLVAQHRGLWHLLDARAAARG